MVLAISSAGEASLLLVLLENGSLLPSRSASWPSAQRLPGSTLPLSFSCFRVI